MNKEIFNDEQIKMIRNRFSYIDFDPKYGKRLFFDNSGGSLRLTSSINDKYGIDLLPDCPERYHSRADDLNEIMDKARNEIIHTVMGASSGSVVTELTASQVFFQVIGSIIENVEGNNCITTNIEHPSAYDSMKMYCEKTGKEFRVVEVNKETGFIDPKSVAELVDKDTTVVSVIAASNISGNINNLREINKEIRKVKPDVIFVSDAVQHVPHGLMDVKEMGLDFANFALYKFYGTRGIGFGYVSDRVANLKHHRLEGKNNDDWTLGTPTPSLFASTLEVIDFVCEIGSLFTDSKDRRELYKIGIEKIAARERYLLECLLDGVDDKPGLRNIEGVEVYLDYEDLTKRDLIVAMGIKGLDPAEAVRRYQELGITVYERVNTSVYSKRIVESLGLTGAIRVSPLHVHTEEDIKEFLIKTEKLIDEIEWGKKWKRYRLQQKFS